MRLCSNNDGLIYFFDRFCSFFILLFQSAGLMALYANNWVGVYTFFGSSAFYFVLVAAVLYHVLAFLSLVIGFVGRCIRSIQVRNVVQQATRTIRSLLTSSCSSAGIFLFF